MMGMCFSNADVAEIGQRQADDSGQSVGDLFVGWATALYHVLGRRHGAAPHAAVLVHVGSRGAGVLRQHRRKRRLHTRTHVVRRQGRSMRLASEHAATLPSAGDTLLRSFMHNMLNE